MKKTWVRKTLSIGVLAAGALLLAPAAAAQAGIDQAGLGNFGEGNGSQIAFPVVLPMNQVGNADSLLGISQGSGSGVNAIGAGGHRGQNGWNDGIGQQSVGNFGIGNGTQIAVPVTMPINACGNATSLGGVSYAAAACTNAIGVDGRKSIVKKSSMQRESFGTDRNLLGNNAIGNMAHNLAHGTGGQHGLGGQQGLGGQHGVGNVVPGGFGHGLPGQGGLGQGGLGHGGLNPGHGNLGNFGFAPTGGHGGNVGGNWGGIRQSNAGNFGFLNGTQFAAPVTAPINICGNSLSFLGQSYSQANCANVIDSNIKKVKPVKDDDGDVAGDDGGYGDEAPADTDMPGDVRGDGGYADEAPDVADEAPADDVMGDSGYGDEAPADELPADVQDDAGYGDELPDTYTKGNGGRAAEKSSLGRLTDLGGVRSAGLGGGLGLLNSLR
ncbi:hypothetical protein FB565_004565 [Actinoplanes lutulentus]|uniref:Small secreted domain DUF320 n=1 Tax=Actinoplanes lutulentus TaxID=1287878 RepID=A0A327Z8W7_9ACTN|nr:chaplin family protein [Actinoplanes lutulentus]MBB2944832.1 hypothetical protein [Actinoplanes lutulentus]RAK35376.1 small secreted domain DUF320 [Actinoplanes lutulentus]